MPDGYKITNIRKRPDIDSQGRFVEVYQIDFVTAKGASSSIRIPVTQFSPDFVKQKVAEEAKALDSLLS